ncbi:hypothetical protein F511_37970 [Dorcoceras hygrometricum]|uniref:Uncharacterized protein n=1 Tax=Dorcoceras hygrometricum TaxID=472368 RepID=A0A2Z7B436_9LAMI|nr:hypothetical protein F511_37970 [Dorcoceras hygrometricum]
MQSVVAPITDLGPVLGAWLRPDSRGIWHFKVGGGRSPYSGPRLDARFLHQSALKELTNLKRTESPRQGDRNESDHGDAARRRVGRRRPRGIQLAVGPQPLRLRNHNFGFAHRIMVKRLATSPHDPLGITDSACKNQLVMISVQYGPFNTYIPIRSTTIDSIGYPRMSASGESSTTMHRLLHASGSHPIPRLMTPSESANGSKVRRLSCRVSMTFRVVRTNQYNQDLGLIHSTNVMSSQSAVGNQQMKRSEIEKRRRTGRIIKSQATVHQQMLFGDSDSKTMSFT